MKFISYIYSHPRNVAILIFFLFTTLYLSTIPSFNVGYADSDEFLTVGYTWGLAHPPGYSLYITVLHLVMKLPIPGTTAAFRAHAVSAIATSLALAILYVTFQHLYQRMYPNRKSQQPLLFIIASLTTLLAIGTSLQLWLYSQITEKYLFAAPLVTTALYLSLQITTRKASRFKVMMFGVVMGLAIAHHQSLVFLLPFWLLTLYLSAKKPKVKIANTIYGLTGLVLAVAFSISLLLAQINQQYSKPVSWYSGDGWQGVYNMITRKDFQGQIYQSKVESNGYVPTSINAKKLFADAANYFIRIGQSSSWWLMLPLLLCLITMWPKHKQLLIQILGPFLLIGPILAGYLGWPPDYATQAITERFYLLSYFMMAPLVFIGLILICQRAVLAMAEMSKKPFYAYLLVSLIPVALLIRLIYYYPQISLKQFDLVSRLYSQILTSAKPNSLISCYSDTSCFALLYEQTVNQLRPDIQIAPLAYPLVHNQFKNTGIQRFAYPKNPFLLFSIVTDNIGKRPVYAVDIDQYFFNLFGISNNYTFFIPTGYSAELTRIIPPQISLSSHDLSQEYSNKPIPTFDLYRQTLVESLAQTHISNAYALLKSGDRQTAQQELNLGVSLSYKLLPTISANMIASRTSMEQTMFDKNYVPGNTVVNPEVLIDDADKYLQQNKTGIAYRLLLGTITIDPDNIPARLALANLYQSTHNREFARQELQNILVLDPTNQQAQALLTTL